MSEQRMYRVDSKLHIQEMRGHRLMFMQWVYRTRGLECRIDKIHRVMNTLTFHSYQ